MKNWINRILKKLRPRQTSKPQPMPAGMGNGMAPQAEAMLRMIENTREVEISCDEAHRLLGQFAEMALRGEDTSSLMPLVYHHLQMCPDCREEYEALMLILQAENGVEG